MPIKKSYINAIFWLTLSGLSLALAILGGLYLYLSPKLPSVESLRQVQLQTPLRVYSSDGKLIGEFGEQRRTPLRYDELPPLYIKALLSAEDAEFYDHNGVSIRGLLRATSQLLKTGQIQSGGSTLTMQLARDFFLTRRQVFSRKFNEILLALQIEQTLSKQEILELFNNKMFFGNRAYGIQAAAHIYYGKDLQDLSLDQYAMIVGVLKAPSAYNPLANPTRAMTRRNWILGRMLELGYIDQTTYQDAIDTPDTARYHGLTLELYAPYIAEMARRETVDRFGDAAYNDGYKVFTTIDSRLQASAQQSLVEGLLAYDRRHGYRGAEQQLPLPADEDYSEWQNTLRSIPVYGGLEVAAVINVAEQAVEVLMASGERLELGWEQGLSSARRYINENARGPAPKTAGDVLQPGDVIRLTWHEDQWHLSQIPQVQGALVALDPKNGAIRSLAGGFDFRQSHFNRVTQAARQPGSSFKPFIYTAALENGFTPASLVNDAPIVVEDASLEGAWRPENDGGTFLGPTRLREAFYRSRNLVSIRIMRSVGVSRILNSLDRFGMESRELPRNLSLALGSYALTPLQMATGYAVFANGGYQVEPYIVARIDDDNNDVVFQAHPATVCDDCPEEITGGENTLATSDSAAMLADPFSIDPRPETQEQSMSSATITSFSELANLGFLEDDKDEPLPVAPRVIEKRVAYVIDSMLRDVVARGTGRPALVLERGDLAGKTGTTNGPRDAWFAGYSPDMVAVSWLGFDQNTPLGRGEYGGRAALPTWINFMRTALEGVPEKPAQHPDGIVTVRINRHNGMRARAGDPDAIFEIFLSEDVPPFDSNTDGDGSRMAEDSLPEELF